MTRRSRIWLVVAVIFTLANLAGAGMAAAQGELLHTGIHGLLLLLGGVAIGRIVARDIASY